MDEPMIVGPNGPVAMSDLPDSALVRFAKDGLGSAIAEQDRRDSERMSVRFVPRSERFNSQHDEKGKFASAGGSNYITADEARGDSRPVSKQEFDRLANEGKAMLEQRHNGRAPITELDRNWDSLKASTYQEVRKSWGGATIDAHTGVPLRSDADAYALSVKPAGMRSVSVPEDASREQFDRAMDGAKDRFRSQLENQSYHLGVFHDDDNNRIDIDPVLVVNSVHEVEAIGAASHAIGGAYHFKSGDGFFPPHVAAEAKVA